MTHSKILFTLAMATSLSAVTLAGCSRSPEAAKLRTAAIGAWGIDLAARDETVAPGADFFRYANGRWLATEQIPSDRSRWGTFDKLATEAETQVRELIESLPANAPVGSLQQKIRDFYYAYLDTAAIEKAGLEPAKPALEAIEQAKSHADIARLMGDPELRLDSPVSAGITIDQKNPDRYIVSISQSGLSLPDREYYLKKEQSFVEIREKFRAHLERMLKLAGEKDAARQAEVILALETRIARHHWPVAQRRQRDLTYNLRTREDLDKMGPAYLWSGMLGAAGLDGRKEYVVRELSAVEELAKEFNRIPVADWKSYLKYHYLADNSAVLPPAFDEEHFEFYGRTLNGQPEQRERWKRAVAAAGSALGEAVGQLYVERHFPPESKRMMIELVENLRKAYEQRIRNLTWMSEETKQVALEKLTAFRPKIGYPDKWRNYAALDIDAADAFGNSRRARLFEYNRRLARIDQPTDRDEWGMTPQTVNAYYNSTFNEIVFPAAILQPPFFDPHADPAVNYGAIGAVIGHEMGHGFDDQGAKSDAKGILRNWWKEEDEKAFKALGDLLAAQYDQYEPLPGLNVNGRFTLGENIGDLGGLTVAYEAYRLSLNGREPPVLDGLTGDQRFFLSWAQCWRTLMREERLRNQILSDPHSPPQYRVNGVVRNMDAWYAAFNVQPEDPLYLPPEERVKIW